jgi:AcrR family transcriptional regulator
MPGTKKRPIREREILRAVIEELAGSDYGALTFERVAARAGVNKTTVYRNWETKAELVRDAILSFAPMLDDGTSTGSLREDLRRIGRHMVEFASSFEGQCLMRLRLLRQPAPELAGVARELQERRFARLSSLVQAAVDRGEISADVDALLLVEMLVGTLHYRLLVKNQPVDEVIIATVVDVLLDGVRFKKPARGRSG